MAPPLRKLARHLIDHLRQDVRAGHYLVVGALLFALMYLNYHALDQGQFIRRVWAAGAGGYTFPVFVVWFGAPYLLSMLSYAAFYRRWDLFRSRDFWIRSTFAITLVAADHAFSWHKELVALIPDLASGDRAWLSKLFREALGSLCAVTIPLLVFWRAYDRDQKTFYGLRLAGFDARPYLVFLGVLVFFVFAASFQDDFSNYYPRLKPAQLDRVTLLPRWWAFGVFEVLYLSDFVWTELLYRGFFVVGMARLLGGGAVLPMSVVYCMIHFGKPEGEAFFAIFGGYALGVFALRTEHLLGGILVHVGIAAMMDGSALFQILRGG